MLKEAFLLLAFKIFISLLELPISFRGVVELLALSERMYFQFPNGLCKL